MLGVVVHSVNQSIIQISIKSVMPSVKIASIFVVLLKCYSLVLTMPVQVRTFHIQMVLNDKQSLKKKHFRNGQ